MSKEIEIRLNDLYAPVSFGGGGGGGGGGGRDRGQSNMGRRADDVMDNFGATMGCIGYGTIGAGVGSAAGPGGAVIGGAIGCAVGGIVGSMSQGYAEDNFGR